METKIKSKFSCLSVGRRLLFCYNGPSLAKTAKLSAEYGPVLIFEVLVKLGPVVDGVDPTGELLVLARVGRVEPGRPQREQGHGT